MKRLVALMMCAVSLGAVLEWRRRKDSELGTDLGHLGMAPSLPMEQIQLL